MVGVEVEVVVGVEVEVVVGVEVEVVVGVEVEVVVGVEVEVVVGVEVVMAKMVDVSLVESQDLNADERVGGEWEVVERYTRLNSRGGFTSSSTTLRNRIGQGYLVRTFYQFYDGQTMHVTMSQTYVPDPNEQWTLPA